MTVLNICPACGAGLRYRIAVPAVIYIAAAGVAVWLTISTIGWLAEWKVAAILTAIVAVSTMLVVWSLGQFGRPRPVVLGAGVTLESAIRMHRRLVALSLLAMAGGGLALTKLALSRLADPLQIRPDAVQIYAFTLVLGDTLIMLAAWLGIVELFDRMLERRRRKRVQS
jgi:hypothetical protein